MVRKKMSLENGYFFLKTTFNQVGQKYAHIRIHTDFTIDPESFGCKKINQLVRARVVLSTELSIFLFFARYYLKTSLFISKKRILKNLKVC